MPADRTPLADRARGRWNSILPALGVDTRFLTGKNTACPACGGKDRFRFDDKDGRGTFICSPDGNGCGAGNGVDLVMRVNGWDFRRAAEEIEELLPGAAVTPALGQARSEDDKRKGLNSLWLASLPVVRDDPVALWLRRRVGVVTVPADIRFHQSAVYLADDDARSSYPAMIAMLRDPQGRPATLHRTYLTVAGEKAPVPKVRRLMPGTVAKGSAVRLMAHDDVLGIAEGIETAFAAASLFSVPCWAATTATLLAQFEPPPDVREVVVFGDNDAKFGGAQAAYSLAHRLAKADRTVTVKIPDGVGQDWNAVLLDGARKPSSQAA